MTKTKTKKYVLKDFFTKTNNEKSTKMSLLLNDEDTGHYLMVKGIQAKSIQRDRIETQVAYSDANEEAQAITDKVERLEFETTAKETIEINFATKLVDDWSFGEFSKEGLLELLEENQRLAFAVIAHSTSNENYLEKK